MTAYIFAFEYALMACTAVRYVPVHYRTAVRYVPVHYCTTCYIKPQKNHQVPQTTYHTNKIYVTQHTVFYIAVLLAVERTTSAAA
jgi:hypothetical protein